MAYTDSERAELFAKFLAEFAKCGVRGLAADRVGLRRHTMRDWIEKYPKFKEKFEEIQERFVDGLETVAIERAKEKSDSLLMFLLKAKRREDYGDRSQVDVNQQGGKIELVFADTMLTEEEKKILQGELQAPVQKKEG